MSQRGFQVNAFTFSKFITAIDCLSHLGTDHLTLWALGGGMLDLFCFFCFLCFVYFNTMILIMQDKTNLVLCQWEKNNLSLLTFLKKKKICLTKKINK